jgi:uncharacterized protein
MGPEAQYRAYLAADQFMLQRGVESGKAFFPPRVHEPVSGDKAEWFAPSGRGTVYALTVVRKRDPEPDYNIVLVDLEEGPRMMSRVDGIAPDAVKIGMAVQTKIIVESEMPFVVFEAIV